jgi:hypothetical protein
MVRAFGSIADLVVPTGTNRDGNGSASHRGVPSHPIPIPIGFGVGIEFPIMKLNSNNLIIS